MFATGKWWLLTRRHCFKILRGSERSPLQRSTLNMTMSGRAGKWRVLRVNGVIAADHVGRVRHFTAAHCGNVWILCILVWRVISCDIQGLVVANHRFQVVTNVKEINFVESWNSTSAQRAMFSALPNSPPIGNNGMPTCLMIPITGKIAY